jgi:hypothetical protein
MGVPTITKSVRKRIISRRRARYSQENVQTALNNLLWKIASGKKDNTITMPTEELDGIPYRKMRHSTLR